MSSTASILIVEDEGAVALDLQERLMELGYLVAGVVARGEDALRIAAQRRPHLVLMDIRLGEGLDGVETARRVRETLKIPVVFVTAYSDWETVDRVRQVEPAGYIIKPFNDQILRAVIATALYKQQLAQERALARESPEAEREQTPSPAPVDALGPLLDGLSHEIRNPLFSLTATADAFEAEFGGTDGASQYAAILKEQVARLTELMTDLVEYGRPRAIALRPRRLLSVLASGVKACERRIQSAGVQVEQRHQDHDVYVEADSGRLPQVFRNLIENAVQHSPRGGVVRVDSFIEDVEGRRWVACRISDDGPGFSAEALRHLFEPFHTHRRGGSGLGLAVVQRVVEQHAGAVNVANVPGGGASVTVRLPWSAPPAPSSASLGEI